MQRPYVQAYYIFSILLIFRKSHLYLVYKIVFVELMAKVDNLYILKYLMCDS